METQPPEALFALAQAIEKLTTQIAHLRTELSEIKRISSLTEISLKSYYETTQMHSQEQNGEQMQVKEKQEQYEGRDKRNPPLVPEGTELTCVRCSYKWIPHARRPQLCPQCKTPWWFPPRWKWHQNQPQ